VRRLWFSLIALLLAGCTSGGDGAAIERRELKKIVLQPSDLPGFQRFSEGRQGRAEQPGGVTADPARFGRVDGWQARFRHPGTALTSGPLVVESRADLFESPGGAEDELARLEEEARAQREARVLAQAPALGEEAVAATIRQPAGVPGARGVRFYLVVWREENVTASVFVNGFEGRVRLEDAIALARKQQRRIEEART
jgi:hypothetical protein